MSKRLTKIEGGVSAWNPVNELWILRLLVNGGVWKAIDADNIFTDYDNHENCVRGTQAFVDRMEKLSEEFSKSHPDRDLREEYSSRLKYFCEAKLEGAHPMDQTPPELVQALAECEEQMKTVAPYSEIFGRNLDLIADLYELESYDKDVLAFFLMAERTRLLNRVCNFFYYGGGGAKLVAEVAACALGFSVQDVQKALGKTGLLATGLVRYQDRESDDIDDVLDFDNLLTNAKMFFVPLTEEEVLASRFAAGKEPELELSDFSHIKRVETLLLPYLKKALAENRTGVNVLLYGEPGTGKTQLSRVLGQALDAQVYEVGVASEDDSNPFRRSDKPARLDFWRSAGKLLRRKKRAILTIDEAEDIFSMGVSFFGFVSGNNYLRENKALINNLLETNPCPTIWMTNSLKAMDSSMIRRFDIVLEVSQPTIGQRRKIIDKLAGDSLSEEFRERLSRTSQLSPAVITRSLKVADAVAPTAGAERDELVASLVNDTLKAQGAETLAGKMGAIDAVYSLKYVNADADLQEVIDGIGERGSARLCLYGPPGTGKSAYAAWLAKELNKPLIVKRASDLLNCFVGGTEANIARAFREAQADGAVLLIDEADSFLQDRNGAHHSWEVTQVNEMLTQIEKYEGILIATTNLIDTLDEASIRRFDLKVKFEALTRSQAQELFEDYVGKLGLTKAAEFPVRKLGDG